MSRAKFTVPAVRWFQRHLKSQKYFYNRSIYAIIDLDTCTTFKSLEIAFRRHSLVNFACVTYNLSQHILFEILCWRCGTWGTPTNLSGVLIPTGDSTPRICTNSSIYFDSSAPCSSSAENRCVTAGLSHLPISFLTRSHHQRKSLDVIPCYLENFFEHLRDTRKYFEELMGPGTNFISKIRDFRVT